MTPVFKWGGRLRNLSEELKRPMCEQDRILLFVSPRPPLRNRKGCAELGSCHDLQGGTGRFGVWGGAFCRYSSGKILSLLSLAMGVCGVGSRALLCPWTLGGLRVASSDGGAAGDPGEPASGPPPFPAPRVLLSAVARPAFPLRICAGSAGEGGVCDGSALAPARAAPGRPAESLSSFPLGPPGGGCVRGRCGLVWSAV